MLIYYIVIYDRDVFIMMPYLGINAKVGVEDF